MITLSKSEKELLNLVLNGTEVQTRQYGCDGWVVLESFEAVLDAIRSGAIVRGKPDNVAKLAALMHASFGSMSLSDPVELFTAVAEMLIEKFPLLNDEELRTTRIAR